MRDQSKAPRTPSVRIQKVNELIRQQLAILIVREVEFPPNTVATIMRVETDPDIKKARIFVSITPEESKNSGLTAIKKRGPYLQHQLNRTLEMHYVPSLSFSIDRPNAKRSDADEAEFILDELKRNES